MDRQAWADEHRTTYLDWASRIAESPYSALDKAEFAVISAHCGFEASVRGFERSRLAVAQKHLAEELNYAGVFAPGLKAGYIARLRNEADRLPQVGQDMRLWRATTKLPGLGWCKASFAACLIDPLGSNIVCLDTHMVAEYGYVGVLKQPDYEYVEALVREEALELDLPMFVYEWATWDFRRWYRHNEFPQDHSFLWTRRERRQLL